MKVMVFLMLALYLLSQIPFLESDADFRMETGSIGAWTDEGLNTSQVRNLVNHGQLNILECDNLLKTPFFSLYHFVQMKLFGNGMVGARFMTLVLSLILLFRFVRMERYRWILILLVPTTLTLLPIHQYGHMALAETISVSSIALAGFYYNQYSISQDLKQLVFSFCFIFLAFLFKIQFLYVVPLVPLAVIIDHFMIRKEKINSHLLKTLVFFTFGVLFILGLWYFPFKNEWALIAKQQSGSFSLSTIDRESLKFNLERYFLAKDFIYFSLMFLFCLLYSVFILVKSKVDKKYMGLLIFAIVWVMIECHKLPMIYLPSRYVVSTYFSMGFLISVILSLILNSGKNKYLNLTVYMTVLILGFQNFGQMRSVFNERQFKIKEANIYLNATLKPKDVVIGPWAPALTWTSGNISMPIWSDFLQTSDILGEFKPRVIVSESDERDSGEAYRSRGIDLMSVADSVRSFEIAHREIKVYWIRKSAL